MSCASCHLEGDMDGRTWLLAGIGPRSTVSLRGAALTGALHWDADACTIHDVAESTIRGLMGGFGLIPGTPRKACSGPSNAGLSAEMDALVAYCATLTPKKPPFDLDASAVARGAAIFNRQDVGCAVCHPAPLYTNSTLTKPFLKHDVGTLADPYEASGAAFDTPSLLMLWDTAPYLHDGSAATLMDVLTTKNRQDLHGRTSHLTDAERADLVTFLMSL
jgi:cytochrome c peroxidase